MKLPYNAEIWSNYIYLSLPAFGEETVLNFKHKSLDLFDTSEITLLPAVLTHSGTDVDFW